MSANVSSTLNHFDLPRAMSHAAGTPAIISNVETNNATVNEFTIAVSALPMICPSSKTCRMAPHLRMIPIIGGSSIKVKNVITAVKYTVYFMALRDDSLSKASATL
jgi:hypothetical protein